MNYIDLHLHLDGSLSPETLFELAKDEKVDLPVSSPEELKKYITVSSDCKDLNEYLSCFDIPLAVLQSAPALEKAAYSLMKTLAEDNMIYAEIRFAPGSHCRKGMSVEQAVEAVVRGVQRGEKDFGVRAQVICCCMRGPSDDEDLLMRNTDAIEAAEKYLGRGVCAIDLAGAEALFPTENFQELFRYADFMEVPYVMHAGEAAGPESIYAAMNMGAKRIGHGTSLPQNEALAEILADSDICIEACITSNLQTRAAASAEEHPVRYMLDRGVRVCLNTDNMTVSGTDMEKEFNLAAKALRLTEEEIRTLQKNAVEAAFLTEEEKKELLLKLL